MDGGGVWPTSVMQLSDEAAQKLVDALRTHQAEPTGLQPAEM